MTCYFLKAAFSKWKGENGITLLNRSISSLDGMLSVDHLWLHHLVALNLENCPLADWKVGPTDQRKTPSLLFYKHRPSIEWANDIFSRCSLWGCPALQCFSHDRTKEKKKGESERNKKSKVLDELFFLSLLFSDNEFFSSLESPLNGFHFSPRTHNESEKNRVILWKV